MKVEVGQVTAKVNVVHCRELFKGIVGQQHKCGWSIDQINEKEEVLGQEKNIVCFL